MYVLILQDTQLITLLTILLNTDFRTFASGHLPSSTYHNIFHGYESLERTISPLMTTSRQRSSLFVHLYWWLGVIQIIISAEFQPVRVLTSDSGSQLWLPIFTHPVSSFLSPGVVVTPLSILIRSAVAPSEALDSAKNQPINKKNSTLTSISLFYISVYFCSFGIFLNFFTNTATY